MRDVCMYVAEGVLASLDLDLKSSLEAQLAFDHHERRMHLSTCKLNWTCCAECLVCHGSKRPCVLSSAWRFHMILQWTLMRTILNVLVRSHTNTNQLHLHRRFECSHGHSYLSLAVNPIIPPLYLSPLSDSSAHTYIQKHTSMNTHVNTHECSWELCHYAAGSISGSRIQRKTTLICMCEMGFCAILPT